MEPRLLAKAQFSGARRPLAPSGLGLKAFGGLVLNRRCCSVRVAGIPEPLPGSVGKLIGAVISVAGIDVVLVSRFTFPERQPGLFGNGIRNISRGKDGGNCRIEP